MFMLPDRLIYIQLARDCVKAREVRSGKSFAEVPEIAFTTKPKARILGIGAEARARQSEPGAQIVNPFGHPRSVVSNFTVGEQFIRQVIRRLAGTSIFSMAPRVIMHPLGMPEGGYTQIELRALREMAYGAGARLADVWTGREPSDQELLNWKFGNGR